VSGLRARTRGDQQRGPVVVLLHAGIADSRAWDPVAERLEAAGARTIAPDLRGFGASPDAAGHFRHVDDVLELLDHRGISQPVIVVGWSMSGTVALELALDHPDRVAALALVCSVPAGMPRGEFVHESWTREAALLEAGDVEGAIANDVDTWAVGPNRTRGQVDDAVIAHVEEVARELLAREGRQQGEAQDGDRDAPARLGELRCPVIVVTADDDTPCHDDASAAIIATVPHATHVSIPNAAHMAPLERPEQVAAALAGLL
jgi:pimeloyl-ACP methyl ester carboxylesterase